jgi:hypothetical protein
MGKWPIVFEGNSYLIKSNLEKPINYIRKCQRLNERFAKSKDAKTIEKIANLYPQEPIAIDFYISDNISIKNNAISNIYQAIIEYRLYDLFLIMNISAPGSYNAYNTYVIKELDILNEKLNLSNYNFEASLLNNNNNNWPKIEFLDINQTVKWFFHIRNNLRLKPESRIEKALFSIIYICKSDVNINTIVWIFYALETLFDTKAGSNYSSLIIRIANLLSLNEKQKSYLKKNMRKLYDIRSSFVHGGLEVVHPIHDERLDKFVDKSYSSLIGLCDFGFLIILSCIQEIIRRNWVQIDFEESITGIRMHD